MGRTIFVEVGKFFLVSLVTWAGIVIGALAIVTVGAILIGELK